MTNAAGCSSTDTLTIFVPILATAGTVSMVGDDLVLCAAGPLTFDIMDTASATLDGISSSLSGSGSITYQWQLRNVSTGNVWTPIAGATSNVFDISSTPLNINEDTQIRRLAFATLNTVSCPAGGAGLPSNVISVNVEEARNPTITTNPGTTVCAEDVTSLVYTVNTINTQLTDTYQWACLLYTSPSPRDS